VRYLSTRDAGAAPATHSFEEVLLAGLAEDGGLFVPETLPKMSAAQLAGLAGRPYAEVAAEILALFAGESFAPDELRRLTEAAYGTFRHAAVAPLVQLDERLWLLELFHGPTLAFKDLPLQLVGRLFDTALARRHEQVTIVGATSGDTGSAALAACRDRAALDIFMLYPHGRISEVQRRQMTTVDAPNAHALAIEGTFDDCQDIVKALFADSALRQEMNLSAVNSINFARVAAQIVYYISAGLALGVASGRAVSFSVPTGNFGNVYAGHLARAMGLPIERLVIGTNANDILARYIASGDMAIGPVTASLSPSMDIQVASNFERLLFELKGRNGGAVASDVRALREKGALPADEQGWRRARQLFAAHRADDQMTIDTIGETYRRSGVLIDPHTAVAVAAARAEMNEETTTPMIALATAHPAKFPEAVARATGIRPPVPEPLAEIMERRERVTVLPNDIAAVARFLRTHARHAQPSRGAA